MAIEAQLWSQLQHHAQQQTLWMYEHIENNTYNQFQPLVDEEFWHAMMTEIPN